MTARPCVAIVSADRREAYGYGYTVEEALRESCDGIPAEVVAIPASQDLIDGFMVIGAAPWPQRMLPESLAAELEAPAVWVSGRGEPLALAGLHCYTVRVTTAAGVIRPPIGAIATEQLARRIAADYYASGSLHTSVEYQGSVIAEWPAPPVAEDAIGRDFAERQRQLDAAREELRAMEAAGADDETLRRLTAEVERLEYME